MSSLKKARLAWGEPFPDWIEALAAECDRTTQRAAAERIGKSAAAVNLVLANRYRASLSIIEETVRGALMSETVACPILGELAKDQCLAKQKLPFACTNPLRVKLYRACRSGCAHSRLEAAHAQGNEFSA